MFAVVLFRENGENVYKSSDGFGRTTTLLRMAKMYDSVNDILRDNAIGFDHAVHDDGHPCQLVHGYVTNGRA